MSIYDFEVMDTHGNMVPLRDYWGQVLLIINSATMCGFTPQYTELNEIYNEFKDEGFTILDFPCNQFGNQAPGTGKEIAAMCRSLYMVPHPIFEKIEVNGKNEEPLFAYLKSKQPFKDIIGQESKRIKKFLRFIEEHTKDNDDIKWNFTKFLVDRRGNVVERFEPTESLDEVKARVMELL